MAQPEPLDREIAVEYIRFLVNQGLDDDPDARKRFCNENDIEPKLLYYNPHIEEIAGLFSAESGIERHLDMTLREWLEYHHHYVHQGDRYGQADLQQRWMGRTLIKSPFECWNYQEIIVRTEPDVVLELGVKHGGASLFYADLCDLRDHGRIIGVDVDLGQVRHDGHERVDYIEGSSTDPGVVEQVKERTEDDDVLVIADSDHEKNHVLEELRAYAELVPKGGYYIVEDTLNDVLDWHPVPNEGPKAAVEAFLQENDAFEVDRRFGERYLVGLNPMGYLRRTRD